MECLDKFTILGIVLLLSVASEALEVTPEPSIPEILAKYGLPIGLLPDSVKSYTLSDSGDFELELEKPCEVKFNYLVSYDNLIQGKLTYGKITDLTGIRAKKFLLWMHVTGIDVDIPNSGYIYFHVGAVSKKLDISWFESVHTCQDSFGMQAGSDIQPLLVERDVQ